MVREMSPGLIVLLGSGETLPFSGKIHEFIAQQLPQNGNVAILETPAGFEPNSAQVAGKIKSYLEQRLQNYNLNIDVLPARKKNSRLSPDNPDIVAPILDADEIILGPGSPTYAVHQLRDTLALKLVQARHQLGATVFLSSAATLAFSALTMPVYEIYKVGQDLHWQPGLDLFGRYGLPFIVIPHWNNKDGGDKLDTSRCYLGQERFEQLADLLDVPYTIIGIDEHTGLILDVADGCFRVAGKGNVTVRRDERETVFAAGESMPLALLGDYHVPPAGSDLPEAIWQQALAHHHQPQDEPTDIDAELANLINRRAQAREQKNWALSDQIRDEINALGWQVADTPAGQQLTPLS